MRMHTCRYSVTPCAACQAERTEAEEAKAFYHAGERFMRDVVSSLPEDMKDQMIPPPMLYLLGRAVAYGRTQERTHTQAAPGGSPDPVQRFDRLDFSD